MRKCKTTEGNHCKNDSLLHFLALDPSGGILLVDELTIHLQNHIYADLTFDLMKSFVVVFSRLTSLYSAGDGARLKHYGTHIMQIIEDSGSIHLAWDAAHPNLECCSKWLPICGISGRGLHL